MSRERAGRPERLLASDATAFERRVLGAALHSRPSPAASARMARAVGVTASGLGAAAGAKTLVAKGAVSKATAAAATSTVWPWISAAVVGLTVAGAVVGGRTWRASRPATVPQQAAPRPAPAPTLKPPPAAPLTTAASALVVPRRSVRPASADRDIREQIALVDRGRGALAAGSPQRALDLLRGYQDRYPTGSFRPEATAIVIEALVKLGRESEARVLATRFVDEHRGSLLAARVAELVGLPDRPGAP